MNEDTQCLIDSIMDLLNDSNCEIDYEREILLRQTIAEIEAKAANGGVLPNGWCY
jgi:hypothetical protein